MLAVYCYKNLPGFKQQAFILSVSGVRNQVHMLVSVSGMEVESGCWWVFGFLKAGRRWEVFQAHSPDYGQGFGL